MEVIQSKAATKVETSVSFKPEGLRLEPNPTQTLHLDGSLASILAGQQLDLADQDVVRLILQGNSVIDWNRAWFPDMATVDRFLRLHLIDYEDPMDRERLRFVHQEAVSYLQEHLGLHFPADLIAPEDVRDVFIHASHTGGFRRRQIQACAILKLMHVINHMEAAELHFQIPLSEAEIMDRAERSILQGADRIVRRLSIGRLLWESKKPATASSRNCWPRKHGRHHLRQTSVSHCHRKGGTCDSGRGLAHTEPISLRYAIPGQSHNNLVQLSELFEGSGGVDEKGNPIPGLGAADKPQAEENPFSGGSYRMVNFIVDFPVRVDDLVKLRTGASLGRTVFSLVEFQVLDRETARRNEEGENAHELYKRRQRSIVEQRLKKGGRWRREQKTKD